MPPTPALTADDIAALRAQVHAALRDFVGFAPLPRAPLPPPGPETISRYIDHTLLKPAATPHDIAALCAAARRYNFASVCVNPRFVPQAVAALQGSPVAVCTVVGFPLGATTTSAKVHEAQEALDAGATELDMVQAIGLLKAGDLRGVAEDMAAVVGVAHARGARVKVILETALLTPQEIALASLLAQAAGADFVKTSTGFGPAGARAEDVALMRAVVGDALGVKASGGVRTYAQALAMIEAGADRIGASAGDRIVQQAQGQLPTA